MFFVSFMHIYIYEQEEWRESTIKVAGGWCRVIVESVDEVSKLNRGKRPSEERV